MPTAGPLQDRSNVCCNSSESKLCIFVFLTNWCESNWPVSAHTQSGSAGIHRLSRSDTSPTAPLLPRLCLQGHDESAKTKWIQVKNENWWKCWVIFDSAPPPTTTTTVQHALSPTQRLTVSDKVLYFYHESNEKWRVFPENKPLFVAEWPQQHWGVRPPALWILTKSNSKTKSLFPEVFWVLKFNWVINCDSGLTARIRQSHVDCLKH